MNRYLLQLAYRGTNYAGWQRQPNAVSVEETLDTALSTVLGQAIKLVGCGRTDAGVHASTYAAHFDFTGDFPPAFLRRMNRFLADDIALHALHEVPGDFHARFHATERGYRYRISPVKDPFRPGTVTQLNQTDRFDRGRMQEAAQLLLDYREFAPFCKAKADNFTNRCDLRVANWEFGETEWCFHIRSDRFLRGMVRLIVGMCLTVGEHKLTLADLRSCMEEQRPLPRPWSAPAAGLYLDYVSYPGRENWKEM